MAPSIKSDLARHLLSLHTTNSFSKRLFGNAASRCLVGGTVERSLKRRECVVRGDLARSLLVVGSSLSQLAATEPGRFLRKGLMPASHALGRERFNARVAKLRQDVGIEDVADLVVGLSVRAIPVKVVLDRLADGYLFLAQLAVLVRLPSDSASR